MNVRESSPRTADGVAFSSAAPAMLGLLAALRDAGYRFITPTPATHERVLRRALPGRAGLRDAFGWSRPFAADLLPGALFESLREAGIVVPCEDGWRSVVRVSSLGDTLLLHSSYPTVQADAVFFGPDSYRFAAAIEAHLQRHGDGLRRALDIGCGAGPGALTIARLRPPAEVTGTDINLSALRLANVNAVFAGAGNVGLRYSNLMAEVSGSFDLIVANPPYLLDPAERSYRHGGGALGAGLSLAIVDAAVPRLAPGGTLLLYTGVAMPGEIDPFAAALAERQALRGVQWDYRELDSDVFGEELEGETYAGAERIAAVLLTVTRPRF